MSNVPTRTVPFGLGQEPDYRVSRGILDKSLVSLPEEVTQHLSAIGDYGFYKCEILAGNLSFPNVTTIGSFAFDGCKMVDEIFAPSASVIGSQAFFHCENLTKITLSNSISTIGRGLFSNCYKLEEIDLTGLVSLNIVSVFQNCASLKTLKLPNCEILGNVWNNGTAGQPSILPSLSLPSIKTIAKSCFGTATTQYTKIADLYLPHKTIAEVKAMANYATWYLPTTCTIHASDGDFLYGA